MLNLHVNNVTSIPFLIKYISFTFLTNNKLSKMNTLFDICVQILKIIAKITGMTYQEANIWIFVILHPLLTLVLFVMVVKLKRKNKELKVEMNFKQSGFK